MAQIDKKVTYHIEGATVDDVASRLESITWDVSGLNQKRHFQVDGGYWRLLPAVRVPQEADPFHPRRTEIAMEAHLILDDPKAAGFTSDSSTLGPYIRFLVSTVKSGPPEVLEVVAIAHNWRWLPPAVRAYFDHLLAKLVRTMGAVLVADDDGQADVANATSDATLAAGKERETSKPQFEPLTEELVRARVAAKWIDDDIARETGYTRKTVVKFRQTHGIEPAYKPGYSPNRTGRKMVH